MRGDRISAVYLVMGIRSGRRTSGRRAGGGGRGDPIYAKAEGGRADDGDGRDSRKKLTPQLSASESDIVVDIVSTP